MQRQTSDIEGSQDVGPAGASAPLSADRAERGSRSRLAWTLRQVAHLATGNMTAIGLGMVTLAFMAQMLGPALLGVLAMVEAYGRLVDQIVRLETWQAVIRYGAPTIESGNDRRFADLIGFGVALDIVGALSAGAIALLALPVAASWMGWDEQTQSMAAFYTIAVAFGISSTPTGILRLFDRFALIAWIDPALAVLRLVAVALVWALGGSIGELLAITIAVPCLQRIGLTVAAWRELRRRGHRVRLRLGALANTAEFEGIWGFILSANGTVLVRKSTQELDILAVGAVAGPIGAGIYQLVRKFTLAAMKAGGMLQQVLLPDLARLWARRDLDGFMASIRQIELLTLAVGIAYVLGVVLVGDIAIRIIAGPAFEDARVPLIVQSVAALVFLSGTALRAALMTMGQQPKVFRIALVAAAAFFVTLYAATPALGVSGAGVAHIVFNLIWLPACLWLFLTTLRRERASAAWGEGPPSSLAPEPPPPDRD